MVVHPYTWICDLSMKLLLAESLGMQILLLVQEKTILLLGFWHFLLVNFTLQSTTNMERTERDTGLVQNVPMIGLLTR